LSRGEGVSGGGYTTQAAAVAAVAGCRELADNFCHYIPDKYDSLEGCAEWAQETLRVHSADKREFTYTR
jgi:hypothetical protein